MPHIELQNVNKVYELEDAKFNAVQDVSLSIDKGEFVSIVGHSGSGKTTLLSIIGAILCPSSGKVIFNGVDVCTYDENALAEYRAEKIGYMFQFSSLLPVLSSKENLLLPTLFRKGGSRKEDEKRAVEYLGMVGLADKVNAYPSQLSGGQQRRVAIARALMNEPEIILADEPTGDLDEETEREVMGFLTKINSERGLTFILVTHSSDLASAASLRLRMSHGRLEEAV